MGVRTADHFGSLRGSQSLRFPITALPLADLLLTAHASRFTGTITLSERRGSASGSHRPPAGSDPGREVDTLFVREGNLVGLEMQGRLGAHLLADALIKKGWLDPTEAEAFAGVAADGLDLCRQLEARQLVGRKELDQAVAERARLRLFARAPDSGAQVEVLAGIEALAHFHPVYIDPRPVIAFGLVVHGRVSDKRAQLARASRRKARLLAPYDARRNAYGLPPPILEALSELREGIQFGKEPSLRNLSLGDTAGVLLLMDRIGLLEVGETVVARSSSSGG